MPGSRNVLMGISAPDPPTDQRWCRCRQLALLTFDIDTAVNQNYSEKGPFSSTFFFNATLIEE